VWRLSAKRKNFASQVYRIRFVTPGSNSIPKRNPSFLAQQIQDISFCSHFQCARNEGFQFIPVEVFTGYSALKRGLPQLYFGFHCFRAVFPVPQLFCAVLDICSYHRTRNKPLSMVWTTKMVII
jgi:hypothetical protein